MRINEFCSQNEDSMKTPDGNMKRLIHNAIFVWVLHMINHRVSKMAFFQGLRYLSNVLQQSDN